MLTSLYPSAHGAGGTAGPSGKSRQISSAAVPLAETLRERGYRTEGLVSSPVLDKIWGFARGFDAYGQGHWGELGEELTLEQAARRLRRSRGERLFLFVHSNIVHSYARQKEPPPPGAEFVCPLRTRDFLPDYALMPMPDSPDAPLCRDMNRAYDRAVACMDRALGELLDELDRPEIAENTLVVVTSDHGELLCEKHLSAPLRGHGYPGYAELVRVPLVVRFPGKRFAGARISSPAREIDIPATILDAAGIPIPERFSGRSLLPLLDADRGAETPTFAQGDEWSSARTRRDSYLSFRAGPEELYDLAADPKESENVAPREEQTAAAMREALKSLPPFSPAPAPAVDAKTAAALRAAGYVK
jgi:arylsulfatase A-like enzyme